MFIGCLFSINGVGKPDIHRQKLDLTLPPRTKVNSRSIKQVNIRAEVTEHTEENLGGSS